VKNYLNVLQENDGCRRPGDVKPIVVGGDNCRESLDGDCLTSRVTAVFSIMFSPSTSAVVKPDEASQSYVAIRNSASS
jgi:hypothetical protein